MKAIIWIIIIILAAWLVIWLVRRTPAVDTSYQEPVGAVQSASTTDESTSGEYEDKG